MKLTFALTVSAVALLANPSSAIGQMAPQRMTAAEIATQPHSGAIAGTSGLAGIRTIVLSGDPAKAGIYTVELLVPAHTRIDAHEHRDSRSAVVVSGTWYFGYGNKAEDATVKALGPGSFYTEPANVAHFAHTGDSAVAVIITGDGPTDTRYATSTDAPGPATGAKP